MEMMIDFPGGSRVDAHFGSFAVHTDQPVEEGGQGLAPAPFEVFLAALGTCAGIYILGFCRSRGISTDGMRLIQTMTKNTSAEPTEKISLEVQLPVGFPEKYKAALIRAAKQCKVKRLLEHPPLIEVTAT